MADFPSLMVVGTDTEVGKTYVTALLLRQLRKAGIRAAGMKPVASGVVMQDGNRVNEDIEVIMQATDHEYPLELVNQYLYEPFIAPHIVAERLGQLVEISRIERAYASLGEISDCVVVESAGGLLTPLNDDESFLNLALQLNLPVLLVVGVRLGCINHALLTQQTLKQAGVPILGWVANYPQAGKVDESIEQSLKTRISAPLLGVFQYRPLGNESAKNRVFFDLDSIFFQIN